MLYLVDRPTVLQIFGSLMKHPQFLSETDKYNLTPNDFYYRIDKFIFSAIDNLYHNGVQNIQPIDVENYLNTNDTARTIFKQQNGIEYLTDAEQLSDEQNFGYYYKKLKKFNLLEVLKNKGISTDEFYIEDITNPKAYEVNKHLEELEIDEILSSIKSKLLSVEKDFIQNDTTEIINVYEGIEEILNEANIQEDVGYPVQGAIFNEVLAGARKGIFVLRSAGSGVGKSRQAVGDACALAFPFIYDHSSKQWMQYGSGRRVLVITTEQTAKEVQKMVLAYLTGINESKFRYGGFTNEEVKVVKQALWILEQYQQNLLIIRMPNPTIELVKTIVRENVLMYDIEYVFYDYIFISPSLLNEFKGFNLRNDEILLMFSTALKDLAVELNIFVMSSTQVNANADATNSIRNESSIAGSRAIINKADIGVVCARPSKEELDFFKGMEESIKMPNMVTDVYKVRSGEWNQVRIWSFIDLGTLRKEDLFVTNARMEVMNIGMAYSFSVQWDTEQAQIIHEQMKYLND